ncbi:MAG: hypothetical protein ACK5B6_05440 [Bacteroidia bacterium]|jgi:hypothetical protein
MVKNLSIAFSFLMFISFADLGLAQQKNDKKFRFPRVSRDVKKEAKKLEKDGYKAFVGQPPIGQQLDKSYRMINEADENGFPKWIVSSGSSVANTQAAAEMQAIELAKSRLVGLIETNFKAVIENTVANNQLDAKDAVSVTKTVEVSANRVAKKLGMIMPVVKIYRNIDKNFEVQVNIAYNYEMARKQMLAEMQAELDKEAGDVRQKYEQFLNPDIHPETIKNYYE